jgi:small GTP-binding protein
LDLDGLLVNFWDTAGQEKFRSLTPIYFREASVIIFAYSITSHESLQGLENFNNILGQGSDSPSVVVVGLKADLDAQRAVKLEDATTFGETKLKPKPEFVLEVSSKTGEGIGAFINQLKTVIQARGTWKAEAPAVTLEEPPEGKKKRRRIVLC